MNIIPEIDEFPRGPYPKQCDLFLYSLPTSLTCLEPNVGPFPVLNTPAGSYEMGLSSQANFACDPCRNVIKWKSYPMFPELTKIMKVTWEALSTGNYGQHISYNKHTPGD